MAYTFHHNYGIDTIAVLNRRTKEPYAILKVIGSAEVSSTIATNGITGGSYIDNVETVPGKRETKVSLVIREYGRGIFPPFTGAAVTDISAEPTGFVGNFYDWNGTTVKGATGIASVQVDTGEQASLCNSEWTIKAVSATTVNVYASSAPTNWYVNNEGLINAAPITITSGGTIDLDNALGESTGIAITGGASSIAMTVGDTAIFTTRKINLGGYQTILGQSSAVFDEFTIDLLGTEHNGKNVMVRIFKCTAPGLIFGFKELEWSESSIELMPSVDTQAKPVADAVFTDGLLSVGYIYN